MTKNHIDIDRRLVEESMKGDVKAQHALYKKYAGAMYYTCFHMMRQKEAAEDMLQESFSEAFLKLERFRFDSSFGAWLKRIVVNKCINEIKRKKTDLQFTETIEDYDQAYAVAYAEEEQSIKGIKVKDIKDALEFLPEGSRIIFQLYLLEGYDHREIADILGVSESNSKSQYMVAKRKVREILKNQML